MTSINILFALNTDASDLDVELESDLLIGASRNEGMAAGHTFTLGDIIDTGGVGNTLVVGSNIFTDASADATILSDGLGSHLNKIVTDLTSINEIFVLTTHVDDFNGGLGNDTFIGSYSNGGVGDGNTFNAGDIINGHGGINTLIINPNFAVGAGAAATTLDDGLWAHVTRIENVDITTSAGALTITAGSFFETAFAAASVDLTATTGAGAINIDMTAFTGAETINAITLLAGAQTITSGSGRTKVIATAFAGSQTITGAHLVRVVAMDDGAGAQTIISTGAGDVTITAIGVSGDQTIKTGAGDDNVTVTTSAGAINTITTGAGNDIITLSAAIGAGSLNTITAGRGADVISLGLQTIGTVDTLVYSPGDSTSTSFDRVTDMTTTDLLSYTDTTALLTNGSHATGVNGLTATSSSGVLTFSGIGATLAAEMAAASHILAATHVSGTVDAFVNGGNTFVLEYSGSISPIVVKLVGVAANNLAIAGTTVHYG